MANVSYEICRYEVHIYSNGFERYIIIKDCEEDAVGFVLARKRSHPEQTCKVIRVERAIIDL